MENQVREWTKKMGYQDKLPADLKSIINPSTYTIWSQIIDKVKPKEEVAQIRKNLIINKLSTAKKNNCISMDVQIAEIEAYNKKKKLQSSVRKLHEEIDQQNKSLESLEQQNKVKTLELEQKKQHVEELYCKSVVYDRKIEKLQDEIEKAKERLLLCNDVTPVEYNIEVKDDVLGNLKKCSEKLSKLIDAGVNPMASGDYPHSSFLKVDMETTQQLFSPKFNSTVLQSASKGASLFSMKSSVSYYSELDRNQALQKTMKQHVQDGEGFLKDEELLKHIDGMLKSTNRKMIWDTLRGFEEEAKQELIESCAKSDLSDSDKMKVTQSNLRKLRIAYIANTAKTIQLNWKIQKLEESNEESLEKLVKSMTQKEASNFRNNLEAIQLYAKVDSLKKSVYIMSNQVVGGTDLESDNSMERLKAFKDDIYKLLYSASRFAHTESTIFGMKQATAHSIRKLSPYARKQDWMEYLSRNVISSEIEAFQGYTIALAGNKNTKTMERLPYATNMEPETISMLAALLEHPSWTPEAIILDILNRKQNINMFKTIQSSSFAAKQPKYSRGDLREPLKFEEYEDTLRKFVHLLGRNRNASQMQRLIELWLEMPFKDIDFKMFSTCFDESSYRKFLEIHDMFSVLF